MYYGDMPLYRYVKTQKVARVDTKKIYQTISYVSISLGLSLLVWVIWPIASFELANTGIQTVAISPIRDSNIGQTLGVAGELVLRDIQTTNANVWFPTRPQKKIVTPVNSYKLSINRLKIADASVIIGADDLNKSLIHYGGTGLPGDYGTTVVFGHSTLPQFFSPLDYRTIFSTLPTMQIGDEVTVKYDGLSYKYKVYDMVVTEPNDLSPLEQRFDDSYITMVTCVPPGTYWKRLNVKAKLERPI